MPSPRDYVFNTAPTVADFPQFNGNWISNLPNDYWQGQQYGIQRQLQTMFQDPNSQASQALRSGNYPAVLGQAAQVGGYPAIAQSLPLLMGMQWGNAAVDQALGNPSGNPGGGQPAPSSGPIGGDQHPLLPMSSNVGSGPGNITGFGGNPSVGSDNRGETTVRSLFPGDTDTPQEVMDRVATAIGARPSGGMSASDAPLTPQQVQRAQQIISQRSGTKPVAASPVSDSFTNQPKVESSASEIAANVGGTRTESPPPPSSNAPNNRAVSQGPGQTTGQETGPLRRPGDTEQALSSLEAKMRRIAEVKARLGATLDPKRAAALDQAYDEAKTEHDQMLERVNKEKQGAYDVQIADTKKRNEIQAAADEKTYAGISGQEQDANRDKGILDLSRSILNDPSLYTGAGAEQNLNWNRIKQVFGDGNAAVLQEAFKKITAVDVMNSLNDSRLQLEQAGIQGGRMFKQSADLVQQAAPQLGSSLAGNRFLVEVRTRMGEQAAAVAGLARNYRATHNDRLGPGFDAELNKYLDGHPLYSKLELANPKLIGAPTVPQAMYDEKRGFNRTAVRDWASKMGLGPGDAVRDPYKHTVYIAIPGT